LSIGVDFDDDGSLWVGNFERNTLVKYAAERFTRAIVAGTAVSAPAAIIGGAALNEPYGHAFDVARSL
jgi:hypothetical protein